MHTRVGCTAEKAFAIYGAAARVSNSLRGVGVNRACLTSAHYAPANRSSIDINQSH